jgi:hypothetical protein
MNRIFLPPGHYRPDASAASALVNQLRELDLPTAELASYGTRQPVRADETFGRPAPRSQYLEEPQRRHPSGSVYDGSAYEGSNPSIQHIQSPHAHSTASFHQQHQSPSHQQHQSPSPHPEHQSNRSSLPSHVTAYVLSEKRRNGVYRRYLVAETSRLLQPVSPHLPPISWPPPHSSELSLVSIPLIDRLSTPLHRHSVMIPRRPRRKLPRELKSSQWHSEKRLLELNKRGREPLCKSETKLSGIEFMENPKPISNSVELPVEQVDRRPIQGVRLNKLLYPPRPCMDDTLLRVPARD